MMQEYLAVTKIIDWQQVFPQPLDIVIELLQKYNHWQELLNNLPDLTKDS